MALFSGLDRQRDYRSLPNNILKFIVLYTLRPQLWVLFLVFVSFPFFYVSLDLPKTMINKIIGSQADTYSILGTEYPLIEALFLTAVAFLALVLINQGFKLALNIL
jgi:putative ABC transport system ATP-binding protein